MSYRGSREQVLEQAYEQVQEQEWLFQDRDPVCMEEATTLTYDSDEIEAASSPSPPDGYLIVVTERDCQSGTTYDSFYVPSDRMLPNRLAEIESLPHLHTQSPLYQWLLRFSERVTELTGDLNLRCFQLHL
jgi:hypothetical protein